MISNFEFKGGKHMRGGARAGAGRKKSNKHTVTFWLTDAEETALKKYLEEMRAPKSSNSPTLSELEEKGQTTIYDYCTDIAVQEQPKAVIPQTSTELFYDWKWQFMPELKAKKKQSKKAAGKLVAEQLGCVYNQLIDDPCDEVASLKLTFLESEAKQLLDRRQHFDSTESILTTFMNNNGYYLTNDEDFKFKHWHYYPLLVKN